LRRRGRISGEPGTHNVECEFRRCAEVRARGSPVRREEVSIRIDETEREREREGKYDNYVRV